MGVGSNPTPDTFNKILIIKMQLKKYFLVHSNIVNIRMNPFLPLGKPDGIRWSAVMEVRYWECFYGGFNSIRIQQNLFLAGSGFDLLDIGVSSTSEL